MRRSQVLRGSALVACIALAVGACAVIGTGDGPGKVAEPLTEHRILVPTAPGGGYDTTARTMSAVMEQEGIAKALEVFNLDGAGGTVGLARMVNEKGKGGLAMMMGLGVVGASYTNHTDASLSDVTPLARLIEEPGAIMVPSDSRYQGIDDLVSAWKADPTALVVGGGSSRGGPDHLLAMQLAEAVGIDPKTVEFVSYDGGGDLLPALLANKVDFVTSGAGEFLDQIQGGQIRVLATTGEERLATVADAPTLKEPGIDLVFTNWRGLVAPPDIGDADRAAWTEALHRLHDSDGWRRALVDNGWTDAFLTGDKFGTFVRTQDQRVAEVLSQLGLT